MAPLYDSPLILCEALSLPATVPRCPSLTLFLSLPPCLSVSLSLFPFLSPLTTHSSLVSDLSCVWKQQAGTTTTAHHHAKQLEPGPHGCTLPQVPVMLAGSHQWKVGPVNGQYKGQQKLSKTLE